MIAPESQREGALKLAEKLRAAVEVARFRFEGTTIPVTISIGVAAWMPDIVDPQELVRRADHFLYEAKRSGRNKVCG